jgi:hypothetical protein
MENGKWKIDSFSTILASSLLFPLSRNMLLPLPPAA